jgi:hypothetical protein
MKPETIKKVMQELGRRGGKATSKKKRAATSKSLEKARAVLKAKRSKTGQNEV